jgi:hypothetical protein
LKKEVLPPVDETKPNISLPEIIQPAVEKFLGTSTQVTTYWFGNAAVPGLTQVTLGDYQLNIESQEMYDDQFTARIKYQKSDDRIQSQKSTKEDPYQAFHNLGYFHESSGKGQPPGQSSTGHSYGGNQAILVNTVNCKLGQPVLIGYSKEGTGSITQGALILIPESSELFH